MRADLAARGASRAPRAALTLWPPAGEPVGGSEGGGARARPGTGDPPAPRHLFFPPPGSPSDSGPADALSDRSRHSATLRPTQGRARPALVPRSRGTGRANPTPMLTLACAGDIVAVLGTTAAKCYRVRNCTCLARPERNRPPHTAPRAAPGRSWAPDKRSWGFSTRETRRPH